MTNSVIARFAEPTAIEVERRAAGSYVDGSRVPGAMTTVELAAAVLPADPDDMRLLPEGQASKGGIVIYAEAALQAVNEGSGIDADVVVWDSRRWQVKKVERNAQIARLAHYKALALEEDP